jgi:GNAT superfamily N-acetyltransferase
MITKKRQGSLLHLSYFGGICFTKTVGSLSGYFISPIAFHVTNVFTEPEWRNQGVATSLLKRLFLELRKNNIQKVSLDDCSDTGRCYIKLGFEYVSEGYPDMELCL